MRGLTGLRVVVTGAAGGIGAAVTDRLHTEGAAVAGIDLRPPDDSRLSAALAADLTDEGQVSDAVAAADTALGGIDAVVAAAGSQASGATHELDLPTFRSVLDSSVLSTFLVVRAVLPQLVDRGEGRIVTFGSTAAVCAAPRLAAYAAAKGAVLQFTRSVAVEYAPYGIRANCLCPGGTVTAMLSRIDQDRTGPDEFRAAHPVGRYADPTEIAGSVAYLLSDDASFVVGAAFLVDGGYSAR